MDKHIFAFYVSDVWHNKTIHKSSTLKLTEENIVHRLTKVIRLQEGEQIILFDKSYNGTLEVLSVFKKEIDFKILYVEKNNQEKRSIKFLLPLLKKEALEEAVYSLSEIGVTDIQLIITQKSRQKLLHEKEFNRLESIVIAAAEQSKNYAFPGIHAPAKLSDILKNDVSDIKIVFDPEGKSFFDIRSDVKDKNITLLIGPEAGLTQNELQEIEENHFQKCKLTKTILRAVQAVALGAGLFKI